jgi:hypothetical protein
VPPRGSMARARGAGRRARRGAGALVGAWLCGAAGGGRFGGCAGAHLGRGILPATCCRDA